MIAWGHNPNTMHQDTVVSAPTAGTPKYPDGSPYSSGTPKYPNGSPYSVGASGEPKLANELPKPILGTGGQIVPVTREEYDTLVKIFYYDATYENGRLSSRDIDLIAPLYPYVRYERGATKLKKDVKSGLYSFQLDEDVAHSMVREPL
jgi:hypothetical protein